MFYIPLVFTIYYSVWADQRHCKIWHIYTPDSAIYALQLEQQGVYCWVRGVYLAISGWVSVYSSTVNLLEVDKYHNCTRTATASTIELSLLYCLSILSTSTTTKASHIFLCVHWQGASLVCGIMQGWIENLFWPIQGLISCNGVVYNSIVMYQI